MTVPPLALPPELFALSAIEDSFVAAIQTSQVAATLAQVDTLPGDMSPQELGDRLRKLPGAFVSFSGGQGRETQTPGIQARYTVFAVTGQGAAEDQRRRGSTIVLGAYALLQSLITTLHGRLLPFPQVAGTPIAGLSIGVPSLIDASRYWSEAVDALGISIYGATFGLSVEFPPLPDATTIADFTLFDGQIALDGAPPGGGSPPLPLDQVSSDDLITLTVA